MDQFTDEIVFVLPSASASTGTGPSCASSPPDLSLSPSEMYQCASSVSGAGDEAQQGEGGVPPGRRHGRDVWRDVCYFIVLGFGSTRYPTLLFYVRYHYPVFSTHLNCCLAPLH
ncbi:hypothetical protein MVEN_01626600 [Mycena venus]|uniref:Uncharacterized protein n=1 Tax=Mycena venus TaxID=2733690 RepID=A0A8H7CNV3_9AGAR|nr:hypothetical protein MVEN_01626600 [Mycena venus]